jgi:hypothetical protein
LYTSQLGVPNYFYLKKKFENIFVSAPMYSVIINTFLKNFRLIGLVVLAVYWSHRVSEWYLNCIKHKDWTLQFGVVVYYEAILHYVHNIIETELYNTMVTISNVLLRQQPIKLRGKNSKGIYHVSCSGTFRREKKQ